MPGGRASYLTLQCRLLARRAPVVLHGAGGGGEARACLPRPVQLQLPALYLLASFAGVFFRVALKDVHLMLE
jgi:hypothetical protein